MVNKNIVFAAMFIILILNTSGCERVSNGDPSNTTAPILTMIPQDTPSPKAIIYTPVTLPEPTAAQSESIVTPQVVMATSTPFRTPSNSIVKPAVTKNNESLPSKPNPTIVKSTPEPQKTPDPANKIPVVTCDGDVCRIITD
ncbi:MAG: hypothetical protein GX660_14730 [Clostridiaceae bacterium]|nr:hypothetical protein [Clostridiaceae bacterium]